MENYTAEEAKKMIQEWVKVEWTKQAIEDIFSIRRILFATFTQVCQQSNKIRFFSKERVN